VTTEGFRQVLQIARSFVPGGLAGWASMFGHMSDVGGKTPSSMPTDARTIYEEGVVIPPFTLYRAGQAGAGDVRPVRRGHLPVRA
jgi:N-methylhydantoinase B